MSRASIPATMQQILSERSNKTTAQNHQQRITQLNNGATETPPSSSIIDPAAFEAYTKLRAIAKAYNVENQLVIPQLVIVGETSVGKSMVVQYFLRFPCSFSQGNIATRCPVIYRLRYNPLLTDDEIHFIQPPNLQPEELSRYLESEMAQIEKSTPSGFRIKPELIIEIESSNYTDFEILDVSGLVGGDEKPEQREAVEKITEHYVRNPKFSIVQVKLTDQLKANAYGVRCVHELCTSDPARYDQSLPPRTDYRDHLITIQTKFDTFMAQNTSSASANQGIQQLLDDFGETYFTNMIFKGYVFSDHRFDDNVEYIEKLPQLEKETVDSWIQDELNNNRTTTRSEPFNARYRELIGIDTVRKQIQQLWLRAFRSALPDLDNLIRDLLTRAESRFELEVLKLKQQDPASVKEAYRDYLRKYPLYLRQYICQKSELAKAFPVDPKIGKAAGTTWKEVEDRYNSSWKRRCHFPWRAHLTYDQMERKLRSDGSNATTNGLLIELSSKLAGARHFERLRQVFKYMVLSHEPSEASRHVIESSEGILYGGLSDEENLPKFVREYVRTIVGETFTVGISWLTQMYTFLSDDMAKNVKKFMLLNDHKPLYDHYKFLYAVDLEYHGIVRVLIREAIQAVKHARHGYIEYVSYDLTLRLMKLTLSIPPAITHSFYQTKIDGLWTNASAAPGTTSTQVATTPTQVATIGDVVRLMPRSAILSLIFGSESYVTANRDPQTRDHYQSGRDIAREIYIGVRGQLLDSIQTSFNANVVMKLNEYDTLRPQTKLTLYDRVMTMTDDQIIALANIQVEEILNNIDSSMEEILDLSDAVEANESALNGIRESFSQVRQSEEMIFQKRQARLEILKQKVPAIKKPSTSTLTTTNEASYTNSLSGDENEDVELKIFAMKTKISVHELLLKLLKKHDLDDLKYGLLQGDSLEQDKPDPKEQEHLAFDVNLLDEDIGISGSN